MTIVQIISIIVCLPMFYVAWWFLFVCGKEADAEYARKMKEINRKYFGVEE